MTQGATHFEEARVKALILAYVLAFTMSATGGEAGRLVNKDNRPYDYVIHWENLEPATKGSVKAREEAPLPLGTGILELVGMRDNIFLTRNDTVVIRDGVMNIDKPAK